MDLAYLAVTLFGMCCAAVAATDTSSPLRQIVDGERSRSLRQFPYHDYETAAYDEMNDAAALYGEQRRDEQGHRGQFDDGGNDVEQRPDDTRLSSRARPGKPDSPVYFIRLPPQPYMYVPGYGYVSQPTRLEPPPFAQRPHSPFMNLPLGYVSNGKPVGVYTLPRPDQQYQFHQLNQQQQQLTNRPKPNRRPPPPPPAQPPVTPPDSPVYNLDKGPYVFNGRPSDVYLLQSAYDNLYSEVLQNIYP